jgi:hypothetical protein
MYFQEGKNTHTHTKQEKKLTITFSRQSILPSTTLSTAAAAAHLEW